LSKIRRGVPAVWPDQAEAGQDARPTWGFGWWDRHSCLSNGD